MKTNVFQRRFYRDWVGAKDLQCTHIVARDTDVEVLTNKRLNKAFALEKINMCRFEIERYIERDRRFLFSLKPITVELTAHPIVKAMALAAHKANVGPMAAVAGAIAQSLGKDLIKAGYREVIIENGGDIFLSSRKTRLVGVYAGRSHIWSRLKLKIKPKDTPLGICTSSGTIGHSLSFGSADSVVILARDAALADAVATATCNRIRSKDDLAPALAFARAVPGVRGAVLILKNKMLSWGAVEFVS
jgi:uncharacterized protein